MEVEQREGVKPKLRRRRLRRDINWQGALKQKGVKQGLIVSYYCILKYRQQVSMKRSQISTKPHGATLQ
jgi:hypothetical protein